MKKKAGFTVGQTESGRITIVGRVAGIDDSIIYYDFVDDKLLLATYDFASARLGVSYSTAKTDYDTISDGLKKKYEEPKYSSDENSFFKLDSYCGIDYIVGISYAENTTKEMNSLGLAWDYEVTEWEQWLIKQDDKNYVLIDHYLETDTMSSDIYYRHVVGYALIDAETVEASVIDKMVEMDNDL